MDVPSPVKGGDVDAGPDRRVIGELVGRDVSVEDVRGAHRAIAERGQHGGELDKRCVQTCSALADQGIVRNCVSLGVRSLPPIARLARVAFELSDAAAGRGMIMCSPTDEVHQQVMHAQDDSWKPEWARDPKAQIVENADARVMLRAGGLSKSELAQVRTTIEALPSN